MSEHLDLDAKFLAYFKFFQSLLPNNVNAQQLEDAKIALRLFYNQGYLDAQTDEFSRLSKEFQKEYITRRCDWCDGVIANTYFTDTERTFCSVVCWNAAKQSQSEEIIPAEDTAIDNEWPEII